MLVNYARPTPDPASDCFLNGDTVHGASDALLVKYNEAGDVLWMRNCVSPNSGIGLRDLVLDTVTHAIFIVGGYTYSCSLDTCSLSTSFSGAFLSKWTYDGACLWARDLAVCGSDVLGSVCSATSIALDGDGRVLVAGNTAPYLPTVVEGQQFPPGSFILACDLDGEPLWARMLAEFGGSSDMYCNPGSIRCWGGEGFLNAGFLLSNNTDTLAIDTFEISGRSGVGHALLQFDPETGAIAWVRFDGLGSALTPAMDMDDDGRIYVTNTYLDTVFFSTDTLYAEQATTGEGFVAIYNTDGALTSLENFPSTGHVYFLELDAMPGGGALLTGMLYAGQGDWNNNPFTIAQFPELFISEHDTMGVCRAMVHGGLGKGTSILATASGTYIVVTFPPTGSSTGTITLGEDTYDSYGYDDLVLAKLDGLSAVGTSRAALDDRLVIYANPNAGSFNVVVPEALLGDPQLQLRIYDSTGRLVKEAGMRMGEQRPRTDVFDVGAGYYMVTLSNGKLTCSGSMVVE